MKPLLKPVFLKDFCTHPLNHLKLTRTLITSGLNEKREVNFRHVEELLYAGRREVRANPVSSDRETNACVRCRILYTALCLRCSDGEVVSKMKCFE